METTTSDVTELVANLAVRVEEITQADDEGLSSFQSDIESVFERLSSVNDDLKASFHVCPQVSQKLVSRTVEAEYVVILESDESLASKTKTKLEALKESLLQTEAIASSLHPLLSRRSVLDQIENPEFRRSIKNVFDRCVDTEKELTEWKKTARRGMEKIAASTIPAVLGIDELLPGVRGRRRPRGRMRPDGEVRRRESDSPKNAKGPGDVEVSTRRKSADPVEKPEPKEKPKVDSSIRKLRDLVKRT
ncbi:MAG: hypothetical protein AAF517_24010, partial [Planctomycetota bacterium]